MLIFFSVLRNKTWVSLTSKKVYYVLFCSSFQDTRMFSLSVVMSVPRWGSDCMTVFKDGTIQSRNFLHPQFLLSSPCADLTLVSSAHESVWNINSICCSAVYLGLKTASLTWFSALVRITVVADWMGIKPPFLST